VIEHGESKLDSLAMWEYVMLLLDKLIGWLVPVRLIMFAAVGASGVVVHLVTLRLAITSNFIANNILTYRDRRLRGAKFFVGLLSFFAICGVGAVANVGIASAMFQRQHVWWLSGLAGIAVGLVWNYAISSVYTWRRI